ncbi:MAG: polyribonucleotide nucleotidyltransferase [Candidatus Niyogibacteria bacterium]|nr:polyribonucleotide nucleotidyltransferase [Candidatus Niyogibacteria bacterium]
MKKKQFSCEFAGRPLKAEFSDLAEQANGSALVRYGDTVVLATAVISKEPKEHLDYFPLSVDYEEKFYAVGEILGSRFLRREGRSSDNAILMGRLIDRTIRPLFDQKIRNEVQVIVLVLSYDEENAPDVPAIVAASLALGVSDVPWDGPIAGIRTVKKDGQFILNPTASQRTEATLEILICGKDGKINMIEAEAKEAPEKDAVKGFQLALEEIEKINSWQKKIIKEIGREKIKPITAKEPDGFRDLFQKHIKPRLEDYIFIEEKTGRTTRLAELKNEWLETVKERFGDEGLELSDEIYEEEIDEIIHRNILENNQRPDFRKLDEIRPLFAEAGILPRVHGSGIFYRGQTHLLSTVTLGSPRDHKLIEGMEIKEQKHFMHQYNFLPFCSGEIKPLRGPGRREIGHGALAEKALAAVIPKKEKFPYTIRIVSETMSSNGSTSMASVCASTLALMDAGVSIKNPVAGIAMGLVMKDEHNYKILTDIQGPEDHHGDMDFKAAGTKEGLTAIQMDVKIEGVTVEILEKTLNQAKEAREKILKVMLKAIAEPRPNLSPFAPKILVYRINPEKIGLLIGPGGKTVNSIRTASGAEIDIEEDGTIFITGETEESAKKALSLVELITKEFKPGDLAVGKVSRIFEFGAMVELAPNQEGLIHISKLAPYRVNKVTDVVNIGDEVKVKIIEIDEKGRVNLALQNDESGKKHSSNHSRQQRNG